MKYKFLILLLAFAHNSWSQRICRTDIMDNETLIPRNRTAQFIKYNFSYIWLKTEDNLIYGIIGDDHERILIKILTARKNTKNPRVYFITGKSNVKGNICNFKGKVIIHNIMESKRTHFGPDNQLKNRIKTQGLLTAKYTFFESKNENHSGIFQGVVKTKWYLNEIDEVMYDDVNIHSDSYFNNAFIGSWTGYDSKIQKICNWADYRVPNSNCDFDIGAGEFNVAEKYWQYGWLDIALKNKAPNPSIIKSNGKAANLQWWQYLARRP